MTRPAAATRKVQTSRRMRRRAQVLFGPDEPRHLGYSRNISRTGMMVGTVRVFAPDTLLKIRITLPFGTFELLGTVIWARQGSVQWLQSGRVGMGIRFTEVPQELLDRIEEARQIPGGSRSPA